MDFINKYKLKLILDNKTLLLCYILLMVLNYIIISNIIFDKSKLTMNPKTINYFYIAIVFCLIVNVLLINFAMKSKTLEISIFNREMISKNAYILFYQTICFHIFKLKMKIIFYKYSKFIVKSFFSVYLQVIQ